MQRFNTYQTAPVPSGGSDWQAEINGGGQTEARSVGDAHSWQSPEGSEYVTLPGGQMMPMGNMPGIRTNLPEDVIQNPLSVEEAHNGSIKAMLARNEGNYVVATFLVGTQGTVSWEGILYDVGNDFITIYQPGRERYIVMEQAKDVAHSLGVNPGIDPFMTLSFMALPVIPSLRITTRGVFDVTTQSYV